MCKTGYVFTTQFTNSWNTWKTKKKPTQKVGLNFWQPQHRPPSIRNNKNQKNLPSRFFKIFLIVYSRIGHVQLCCFDRSSWDALGKIKNDPKVVYYFGSPNRIRTGVLALKGRCPRPLDDGAKTAVSFMPANYTVL